MPGCTRPARCASASPTATATAGPDGLAHGGASEYGGFRQQQARATRQLDVDGAGEPHLVEQYLDFARELGDHFAVMERGAIVYACDRDNLDEGALRRAMAI